MNQEKLTDGFSSDEEFKEEQIFVQDKPSNSPTNPHREQIKYLIPPASEIKDKPYPLHPDIASGWIPRILLPNPIPLIYQNCCVDTIVRQLLRNRDNPNKIAYLGPRYQNSYFIHHGKPYEFPYSHIRPPGCIKFTNRAFLGNNPVEEGQLDLNFDSLFESGNLDCAVKVAPFEYDLFIQVDTNTKGHLQWYNFKITKAQKGAKYRFNICNFQKSKSLYTRGMKPFILSKMRNQALKTGWQQMGENLRYESKPLRFKYEDEKFYRLSFDYTFEYDEDEVQFAYCVPYEYSHLMKWIGQLAIKSGPFLKVGKLCTSLGALEVPLLTIHEEDRAKRTIEHSKSVNMHEGKPDQTNHHQSCQENTLEFQMSAPRKCIVISGRAHPGESNGSFMMQGFLEFLCGPSQAAQYLRRRIVFKVVPMLNPDGVVAGNYRTGLSGKDFNRQFLNPDRYIFPEILALKDLVIKCKREFKNNLLLFLDFHGHSIKKNVFMYGPQFPITDRYYYQSKILPKLLSRHSEMFRYYSCIFRISSCKETTARAILLKKLDIPFTFTIQASNGSYYNKQKMIDIKFTPKLWIEMGSKIGQTIHEYCSALIQAQQLRIEKMRERQAVVANRKKRNLLEAKRVIKFSVEKTAKRKIHKKQQIEVCGGLLGEMVQEIKEADAVEIKRKEAISDDEMSEGSSDQQKETDDLSPDKMRKLYKIINSKKFQGFQKCKMSNSKENLHENVEPQVTTTSPTRLLSSQSNPQQPQRIYENLSCLPNQSTINLINIIINNDSGDQLTSSMGSPGQQLPPIQVFTNRGKVTVRHKLSRTRGPSNQHFFDTVRHRPTAKVSNISFFNPFWQEQHKSFNASHARERADSCTVSNNTRELSATVVDSLRRTYNIYKEANKTYAGFPDPTRQYNRQLQFKNRVRNDRKSVNYSGIYMNR